jgi:hypothetical protein
MRRPFRTRNVVCQNTRHPVPGWYEPSRWDEEEGTANPANLEDCQKGELEFSISSFARFAGFAVPELAFELRIQG